MTQFIGQIAVILEAANPRAAEQRLRFLATHLHDTSSDIDFADHNGDVEDYPEVEAECEASLRPDEAIPIRFDGYEIAPCQRFEEPDSPGKFYFEQCEPHEAHVWTLYGHIPRQGVEAIGDFATRQHAEEIHARITGRPYHHTIQPKGE